MSRPLVTFGDVYDPRRNNFDFLRFVLAALVLVSHAFSLTARPDPIRVLSGSLDLGRLAVEAFFVLSGFLVAQSREHSATLAVFAAKRALRVLPALLAAVVFSAFVVGPLASPWPLRDYLGWSRPWLLFAGVFFHRYLPLPGLFPGNPFPDHVNGSLWSLRYEILCYVLVAALGSLGSRAHRATLAGIFLAASVVTIAGPVEPVVFGGLRFWTPPLVACFTAGMLFWELRDRVPHHRGVALAAALVLGGTVLGRGTSAALPLAGGYLLLFTGFSPRLPLSGFGRRGDLSYGLYVYAYPVQQLAIHLAGGRLHPLIGCAVALPATLGLAALSWRFVEAPALARKPGARPAAATAVGPDARPAA
jgi:peptidoglycan/LPS O-acetylase OafA/YrhL